ncbi:MAG: hypothetical protein ACLSVD_01925 [Eggerthellaceae bacterium]
MCIAPGTIVVYERNGVTNALLRRRASGSRDALRRAVAAVAARAA